MMLSHAAFFVLHLQVSLLSLIIAKSTMLNVPNVMGIVPCLSVNRSNRPCQGISK